MRKNPDYLLLIVTAALIALGLTMVFSASSVMASAFKSFNNDPLYFFKRQLIWAVLGALGMFIAWKKIDIIKLRKFSVPVVIASAVLLGLVFMPHIGLEISGAKRWINLGVFSFQPAEIAKFALIFYLADVIARRGERIKYFWRLIPAIMVMGAFVYLIEKEPDLGSALLIGITFLGMLFLGGAKFSHVAFLGSIGLIFGAMKIFQTGYRFKRIMAFLNPWGDPLNSGYQIIQSLIAIGSGGLFGVGLGASRQKFFYLPEQHTDFIFAILGEELGLIGTLAVIAFFIFFIYRGFKIALGANNSFLSLLAGGITFMIGFQAFLNMGVAISLLPATGVPLPFISFGGSSLLLNMIGVGFLLNISSFKVLREESDKKKVPEPDYPHRMKSMKVTVLPGKVSSGF